ncbi:MAG: glycosyltransferase [Planctomycetota bacterium]|nr:glycosyltransferase [Planctomycetota bacterium]
MRIVHLSLNMSRKGGGIPPVVDSLAREQKSQGHDVSVVCIRDKYTSKDYPYVEGFPYIGHRKACYCPGLIKQLSHKLDDKSILHLHYMWTSLSVYALKVLEQTNCKLILTPHGCLKPWALNNNSLRKRVAFYLYERELLGKTSFVHCLTRSEAKYVNNRLSKPVAVLPNGFSAKDIKPCCKDQHGSVLRLLFIGRLHKVKNLDSLLRATLSLRRKDWKLQIACPVDGKGHYKLLQDLTSDLGLSEHVQFVGPAYGEEKVRLLRNADLFVLPSHSEGFSMAVLEAMAYGLPCLLTPECNFSESFDACAALECSQTSESIAEALTKALEMPRSELYEMGARGRQLVLSEYSWKSIADKMTKTYEWALGGGQPPEWVVTD